MIPFDSEDDVRCSKCGKHPEGIIWDYTFDYDGNDRIHEYGRYYCQCGHDESFPTNDPYENEGDE